MISVVMATYNGERYIDAQLASIADQTRPADEVIIFDDGSNDGTVARIEAFIAQRGLRNWSCYRQRVNKGYCLNFYDAIEKAQGDVIFLSDQDDVWLPQKIEKMAQVMEEHADIYALSSRYSVIDAQGRPAARAAVSYLGKTFDGSLEPITVDSLIGCSWVRGFSMCFRSALKTYLKPIDLQSMLSHDWYICLLAAGLSKCCFLNLELTQYRFHGENVSLNVSSWNARVGNRRKRLRGLEESIRAHAYIRSLNLPRITSDNARQIDKMLACERKRASFLQSRNIFTYLSLLRYLPQYKRYYKGRALRVYLGDFLYAYQIGAKKKT